jgi:outer membrane protein TolC
MRSTLLYACLSIGILHAETIDLATALRLAGASPIELQIAQQQLIEAQGIEQQRVLGFIPTLSIGFGYKNHQGAIQDVAGSVFNASKQAYNLGATASLDLELGEAWYQRLSAKQQTAAAGKNVDAIRLTTQAQAAAAYFDLVRAQAAIAIAQEAVRISEDYGKQISGAVASGVAFKGDALRVQVQTRRNQLKLEKAKGAAKQASVALAAILRLDPGTNLEPADREPQPIKPVQAKGDVAALTAKALAQRPELAEQLAQLSAAAHQRDAAIKGPWVPRVSAQAFGGALDGGTGSRTRGLDDSQDYIIGLSWKIGSGGLFDRGRRQVAEAKLKQVELGQAKVREAIVAQVVAAHENAKALAQEVVAARAAVTAAEENNKLTRERQEFAVGIVMETILAEQELTQARTEYLDAVTSNNAAQYLILRSIGQLE